MSLKNRIAGFAINSLMKMSNKLVDTAMLVQQRPAAAGEFLGSVDGKLQRNVGGDRLILSPRTLFKLAHLDPIVWAIISKYKTRLTKMRWDVGPDIEDEMAELRNLERIAAAALSPYAPPSYKPVYEANSLPKETAKPLIDELNKLTAKTPQARLKARWLFDEAEAGLLAQKGSEAFRVTEFLRNCNQDSPDPFKDLLEFVVDGLAVYDAGAIVKRRTKGGAPYEMYALENPSQIVRYRNPDFSTPQPPYRAYGWEVNGRNIADFTADDLLYMMANPTAGGYGFSPLEASVHTIMASLYADSYNLDTFRNQIPPAIMNLGPVTDAQRLRFRTEWQNEVMGRGGVHRIMFVNTKTDAGQKLEMINTGVLTQKEMEYQKYLTWTLTVKCMVFQISPQDIGYTADLHRTTAEVQQAISSEGVLDMANLIEGYFNNGIIRDFFGIKNAKFKFVRDEDPQSLERAQMDEIYIQNGVLAINDVRKKLGQRPLAEGGDEPMILTRTGLVPVSNVFSTDESASLDAESNAPDESGAPTEGIPARGQGGSPANGAQPEKQATAKFIQKLRGADAQDKATRRKRMRQAKENRQGLIDTFANRLKGAAEKQKDKAVEATKQILEGKS